MNKKNEKAVKQYLQRYAEPEIDLVADWPSHHQYQHVVLLPAYKESVNFLENMLRAKWFHNGVLTILVINQPATANDATPQQTLYDFAVNHSQLLWQAGNLTLLAPQQSISTAPDPHAKPRAKTSGHLLLVNRFEHPIPVKQGVGLARKIAADLALALIKRSAIATQWICSTDADAMLPDDYFTALTDVAPSTVAACYGFKHIAALDEGSEDNDPEITAATLIYERAMRYYVAGLHYAGSPYAHFTIGSILAVTASAYASVRGFPKRAAGEDFYLLNKLVKLGDIARLTTTIELQARLSDRVPFGTGVSAAKIMQLSNTDQTFDYYHPQIFEELRNVLEHFDQLWSNRAAIDQWLEALAPHSAQALLALGLQEIVGKLQQQCRNQQQFNRQLTGWFDGLKTLQFVHLLRDLIYPNLPLEQAIQQANFIR